MSSTDGVLDVLFSQRQTPKAWRARGVPRAQLEQIYDAAKWGPTSANCSPLRMVFVDTSEGKARLRPALSSGNVDRTMQAPVTAIFADDLRFYEHLPRLFPRNHRAAGWFGEPRLAGETAARNATLQAAYFMLAARALGLDVGPMSGFDAKMVDTVFFPCGRYRANFLCNIGYGDIPSDQERLPRLSFAEVARFE